MRHPVAGEPEHPAARGLGRDLHGDLPLQRRHRDLGAERRVGDRHQEVHVEVVALALEARVGPDRDLEVEVAAAAAGPGALTRDPDARARVDAGRDLHLEVAPSLGPAGAAALGARLAVDVSGPAAGLAGLVQLERDGLARPAKRLLERELDRGLGVAPLAGAEAAPAPLGAAQVAEVAELRLAEPTPPARAADQVAEDGPEEIREAAGVAAPEAYFLT